MWADLWLILKGYSDKAAREREERAYYYREIYSLLYNVNRGATTPPLQSYQVYPLSIDKEMVGGLPTEDDIKEAMATAKKMSNGN